MPRIRRGIVPARKRLLPLIFLIGASMPLAARADSGIVDVRTLPRLEGAVEDTSRTQSDRLSYGVGSVVAITTEATKQLLAADGWVQFLRPLDEKSTILTFKKAQQGLSIHFTQGLGRPDQSVVYYSPDRITSNVPFPPEATASCLTSTGPISAASRLPLSMRRSTSSARRWPRSAGSLSPP